MTADMQAWALLGAIVLVLYLLSSDINEERPGYYNRGVLQQTSPEKLRRYVAKVWESKGYNTNVSHNSAKYVDVLAQSQEEDVAINVRRRQETNRVGANAVENFKDSLQKSGADRGIMVSSSYYTTSAREKAEQYGIQLMNGEELAGLFTEHNDIPE